jgi:phage recombination protein Bet
MTRAIEKHEDQGLALELWGRERLEALKQQIAWGASDAELDLFAAVCKRTKLDPFAKQIWSVPRRRKQGERWVEYQVIQIGVHGLRLIAQRSREYGGQDGPYWCGEDGEWIDVWLAERAPKAARVGVMRQGWAKPIYSVAVWDRSVQKDSTGKPMALWATRGPEMLALAAERDALRRAFPMETAEVEVVMDAEEQERMADRYRSIFGDEESGTAYDLPAGGGPLVEKAHAAARARDEQLDQLELQRQKDTGEL